MKDYACKYYNGLKSFINDIIATDGTGNNLDFYQGLEKVARFIIEHGAKGKKLMFIGNGASAAISSHMSTDFCKNAGIRAMAFNDGALLTCMGNDFGYEHVFEKPIEMLANREDILVAISSSGQSENILLGVHAARRKECRVLTLSGFKADNPLRSMGDYNFYVPAAEYAFVEVLHHSICHCILNCIISKTK